jgi:hypothetical protein
MVICGDFFLGWFWAVGGRFQRGFAISTGVFGWFFAGNWVVFCGENVVIACMFLGS